MQTANIPGFTVHNVDELTMPVLVSVPHAGRDYPDAVFANLRLPPISLRRLEDRYADLLARDAIRQRVPTIIAHRARAWIDLNRDERDIDVEMVSGFDQRNCLTPGAKQRGGLGLIPRRLSGEGDIWKRTFQADDINTRISGFHRPYHASVTRTLSAMRDKFGVAILLDLHSMPPLRADGPEAPPSFVIGDRFGKSAGSRFAHLLMSNIRMRGFGVALNHPYSGDYMLTHHAAVHRNIHALQLEVDRSLYLDSALQEPGKDIATVSTLLAALVQALADEALGTQTMIAAE